MATLLSAAAPRSEVKDQAPRAPILNKDLMLRVWKVCRCEMHDAVVGLAVVDRPPRPTELRSKFQGSFGSSTCDPDTHFTATPGHLRLCEV
mmetsp:Transcript_46748/g.111142  ORF Transcript_46748/g.111142 Transcript_46748/m.111142 type:complete len:91 (-) Transcript_46748:225-497(-)